MERPFSIIDLRTVLSFHLKYILPKSKYSSRLASHKHLVESELAPNLGTNSTFFRIIDEVSLYVKVTIYIACEYDMLILT
jgi:hypothetical protein